MNPKPLPPLENPDDPKTPAKELFGRKTAPAVDGGALDRLLHPRLPRRRRGAADQRPDLAGDAAVAQPQLGPSRADQVARALRQKGAVDRLARFPGRRHGAAARRPDDHRPLEPSGRARRRHLADADAGSRADPPGARGDVGHQHRQRRMDRRQAGHLVGKIHRALQDGRAVPARSSACSPTRRSRRRCAATSKATAPGCTRSGRWSGTTTISMCASAVRRTAPSARRSRCRRTDEGCGKDLDWWFTKRLEEPKPSVAPKPILMSALPPACKQILMAQ